MQILRISPKFTESEILEVELSTLLWLNKVSRWFSHTWEFGDHRTDVPIIGAQQDSINKNILLSENFCCG